MPPSPRRLMGGRGLSLAAIGLALAAAAVILPRLRNAGPAETAEATAARQAIAAKDWPTARTRVTSWVSARPQSPEAQQALATVEFAEGRLNEAFDAVKLARKLGGPEDDLERLEGLILGRSPRPSRCSCSTPTSSRRPGSSSTSGSRSRLGMPSRTSG